MYFDVTEIVPTVMGRFKFDKDDEKVCTNLFCYLYHDNMQFRPHLYSKTVVYGGHT